MNRIERIYRIHELLRAARRPVPMRRFMEELESSRNTVTRDFEYLRDVLGAPLEYCREANGHRYDPDAPVFELPGFWMNPGELYALLACEQLLENVQPGLIAERLAPLRERVLQLLGESGHDAERINERIRIQSIQTRAVDHNLFDPVAEATLAGRQFRFHYRPRSDGDSMYRRVHPQRLLHYRSNWYLLAWCTRAEGLRLFSLDRIREPVVEDDPSDSVPATELDHFLHSGFGIFGGASTATAHLRFSRHAARWVAEEMWFPGEIGEWRDDGYHLWVPYADERELVMEVLRYGTEVEVLGPGKLREEVARRVREMSRMY